MAFLVASIHDSAVDANGVRREGVTRSSQVGSSQYHPIAWPSTMPWGREQNQSLVTIG